MRDFRNTITQICYKKMNNVGSGLQLYSLLMAFILVLLIGYTHKFEGTSFVFCFEDLFREIGRIYFI